MSLLRVHNLGKAYRTYRSEWQRVGGWFGLASEPKEEQWTLRGVSFEIGAGEAVGIVGKNGAGKSTLLKMITGTLQPTEGKVQVDGRIAAILELGMGFNGELTGRQNVFHAAGLMGFAAEQIEAATPQIEAFAEIGEYFDHPVRTYSSGMQARVAFAVATAFRPDILIVDEALSVGDAYFQAKCYERIAGFKEDGTTLILVTHSVGDIVKHCNRALLIRAGQLVADATSREVTNLYLDELFGKCRRANGTAARLETAVTEGMLAGGEELFHTRLGYRKEEHRWGHGGATILDYRIVSGGQDFPHRIDGNAQTDFYFKVRFDNRFESVVPGLLIKTLDGIFLYGTNSFISSGSYQPIVALPGEVHVFRFSLPMTLNEGSYLISLGISSGDPLHQLIPLERRYDAIVVSVARSLRFSGIVDLQASFESGRWFDHG